MSPASYPATWAPRRPEASLSLQAPEAGRPGRREQPRLPRPTLIMASDWDIHFRDDPAAKTFGPWPAQAGRAILADQQGGSRITDQQIGMRFITSQEGESGSLDCPHPRGADEVMRLARKVAPRAG